MKSEVPLRWWAPLACVAYLWGSLLLGERFPFSRFSMYADLGYRPDGAFPLFLADGRSVEYDQYRDFSGIDPAGTYPNGIYSSLGYRVQEARRWLEDHEAAPGVPPGPIRFQVGYRIVSVGSSGVVEGPIRIVQEGRAWPVR